MQQTASDTGLVQINLWVTNAYTFTGRINIYKLGDMNYGEWVIYRNNYPAYYFNAFDAMYEPYIALLKHNGPDVETILSKILKKSNEPLSLKMNFWGMEIKAAGYPKLFTLQKFPVRFFE